MPASLPPTSDIARHRGEVRDEIGLVDAGLTYSYLPSHHRQRAADAVIGH